MRILKDLFSGIYNLVIGLFATGKHLGRHAITLQYPKERWPMPERSRGVVILLSDPETGQLNCTACMLCMKACPSAAIMIEREKNENKKWEAIKFEIDNTICCFCGLCEEACNFDAIKLTGLYEMSVYDQDLLHYDRDTLQEMGRDVKYTPRPKKKPPVKKAAPAQPAQKADPAKDEKPAKDVEKKADDKPVEDKKDNPPVKKDQAELNLDNSEDKKETKD